MSAGHRPPADAGRHGRRDTDRGPGPGGGKTRRGREVRPGPGAVRPPPQYCAGYAGPRHGIGAICRARTRNRAQYAVPWYYDSRSNLIFSPKKSLMITYRKISNSS